MNVNKFEFSKWQATLVTTVEKLSKELKCKNLIGKSIKEIWNIGIIFNEDCNDNNLYVELDEPIIFILDDIQLEILAVDGSTFCISHDTLMLDEVSFQGVNCNKNAEKYLSRILNKSIIEVNVIPTNECDFTGSYGLELPKQEEYIDEIVIKFNSGDTLHITAWFDYMHIYIRDKQNSILALN